MNIEFIERFDQLLLSDVNKRLGELKNITSHETLNNYLQTVVPFMASGKRIRPYLAAIAYSDGENKSWEEIANQLIALEYFHAFALIHDDIMDRSHTRRGIPTIHTYISSKINSQDNIHSGYSQAIIIGDLLHSFSQEMFMNSNKKNIDKAYKAFSDMSNEVMLGQMLDLHLINLNHLEVDTELITKKMVLKTAGYTFVNPLKIGAILSGNENNELYTDLGSAIGIAYQIKDDILDITGSKDETGKTPLCDVKEGQKTLLTDFIIKNSKPEYKNSLLKFLGKEFSESEHSEIKNIFIDSGSIEYAEQIAVSSLRRAKDILESSNLSENTKKSLGILINKLEIRKS
jgi:geranylgeranyl diphosphate synthase type I